MMGSLNKQPQEESLEEGHDVKEFRQTRPCPRLPIFSKYGHWIRPLPGPREGHETIHRALVDNYEVPDPNELFLHLINHCSPDVQVVRLTVFCGDMNLVPHDPWRRILGSTLPRVRDLSVASTIYSGAFDTSTLTILLNQCSTVLERQEMDVEIPHEDRKDSQVEERAVDEPTCFPSLKELILTECENNSDTKEF
jgi:hypothetical protein